MDKKFRIAVIPGDGIGNEVVPEGLRVLDRLAATSGGALAFEYESFPWGCEYYLRTGRMIDNDALLRLSPFDAIYFGAVGWPGVPDHVSLWGLRLAICQGFDQYASARCACCRASSRGSSVQRLKPWTGSSSGKTAKVNTPALAGATCAVAAPARKLPYRLLCSQ